MREYVQVFGAGWDRSHGPLGNGDHVGFAGRIRCDDPVACGDNMGCDNPMGCDFRIRCRDPVTCDDPIGCDDHMACGDPTGCDDRKRRSDDLKDCNAPMRALHARCADICGVRAATTHVPTSLPSLPSPLCACAPLPFSVASLPPPPHLSTLHRSLSTCLSTMSLRAPFLPPASFSCRCFPPPLHLPLPWLHSPCSSPTSLSACLPPLSTSTSLPPSSLCAESDGPSGCGLPDAIRPACICVRMRAKWEPKHNGLCDCKVRTRGRPPTRITGRGLRGKHRQSDCFPDTAFDQPPSSSRSICKTFEASPQAWKNNAVSLLSVADPNPHKGVDASLQVSN